jgi:Ca-activated chloride channel family protein
MKIDVNNNYIVGETENDIYVKLDFSAIKYETEKKLPLNISLVLDRSGSMAGEKLDQAKKSVIAFIDSLSPNDYLSIVTYESG